MGQPTELAKEGSIDEQIKEALDKDDSGAFNNLATSAATLAALFASLCF